MARSFISVTCCWLTFSIAFTSSIGLELSEGIHLYFLCTVPGSTQKESQKIIDSADGVYEKCCLDVVRLVQKHLQIPVLDI